MYKTFVALLSILWVIDILNISTPWFSSAMLDTTIPINGLAWVLIWFFVPSTSIADSYISNKGKGSED